MNILILIKCIIAFRSHKISFMTRDSFRTCYIILFIIKKKYEKVLNNKVKNILKIYIHFLLNLTYRQIAEG